MSVNFYQCDCARPCRLFIIYIFYDICFQFTQGLNSVEETLVDQALKHDPDLVGCPECELVGIDDIDIYRICPQKRCQKRKLQDGMCSSCHKAYPTLGCPIAAKATAIIVKDVSLCILSFLYFFH